jgi:hypothetical protein
MRGLSGCTRTCEVTVRFGIKAPKHVSVDARLCYDARGTGNDKRRRQMSVVERAAFSRPDTFAYR